jgi:hypothetical protein
MTIRQDNGSPSNTSQKHYHFGQLVWCKLSGIFAIDLNRGTLTLVATYDMTAIKWQYN